MLLARVFQLPDFAVQLFICSFITEQGLERPATCDSEGLKAALEDARAPGRIRLWREMPQQQATVLHRPTTVSAAVHVMVIACRALPVHHHLQQRHPQAGEGYSLGYSSVR